MEDDDFFTIERTGQFEGGDWGAGGSDRCRGGDRGCDTASVGDVGRSDGDVDCDVVDDNDSGCGNIGDDRSWLDDAGRTDGPSLSDRTPRLSVHVDDTGDDLGIDVFILKIRARVFDFARLLVVDPLRGCY